MKAYFFNDVSEFFLEWEMFLDRSCRENSNFHFICTNFEGGGIVPFMVECEKNKKMHCCDSTATIVKCKCATVVHYRYIAFLNKCWWMESITIDKIKNAIVWKGLNICEVNQSISYWDGSLEQNEETPKTFI